MGCITLTIRRGGNSPTALLKHQQHQLAVSPVGTYGFGKSYSSQETALGKTRITTCATRRITAPDPCPFLLPQEANFTLQVCLDPGRYQHRCLFWHLLRSRSPMSQNRISQYSFPPSTDQHHPLRLPAGLSIQMLSQSSDQTPCPQIQFVRGTEERLRNMSGFYVRSRNQRLLQ